MTFKCKIGFHLWDGCKCANCAKTRDKFHNWSEDCEYCIKCDKTRKNHHDWSKDCEKCAKCGRLKERSHIWTDDCERCTICGKTRVNQHDWKKDCEKCSKCSLTRENHHNWSKNCEKCSKCGLSRVNQHNWKDCECTKCGMKEEHKWDILNDECKECKKKRSYELTYSIFKTVLNNNSVKIKKPSSHYHFHTFKETHEIENWTYIGSFIAEYSINNFRTSLYVKSPKLNDSNENLEDIDIINGLQKNNNPPPEFKLIKNIHSLLNCDVVTQTKFFRYFLSEMLIHPTVRVGNNNLQNIDDSITSLIPLFNSLFTFNPYSKSSNISDYFVNSEFKFERDCLSLSKTLKKIGYEYVEGHYARVYRVEIDKYIISASENVVSL